MEKHLLLLCTGLSGSGKTTFIKTYLPSDKFYNLKSITTRKPRENELYGANYYFESESEFESEPKVTNLWVNQEIWNPGMPKWQYGVPECEVYAHIGYNLVYDVIQPMYARQMIDWFNNNNLDKIYTYCVLYFIPPQNQSKIVQERSNMPNDAQVRKMNTCDPIDFLRVGLTPDFMVKSSAEETIILPKLTQLIQNSPVPQKMQQSDVPHKYEQKAKLLRDQGIDDIFNHPFDVSVITKFRTNKTR